MDRSDLKCLYEKIGNTKINSGIFSTLPARRSLAQLEFIRKSVNWEFEYDRHRLYIMLCELIRFWEGPVPKLEDIFRAEEIEYLLIESMKSNKNHVIEADLLFEFIAETGYKDKPLGGEPSKLRTTAVHQAARRYFSDRSRQIRRELFDIYDNFEMNYTDDSGLSHLHVACVSGCAKAVEKFLEHGQDPNLVWEETGDTPLHMALANGCKNLIRLLLSRGADPNVANKEGLTALHVLCQRENDDGHLSEIFFDTVQAEALTVDALDAYGNAPLHFAVDNRLSVATESLLRLGANPNLTNEDGSTALHVACSKYDEVKLVEMLLNANKDPSVHVNVRDRMGRTPLHLALELDNERTAELLLRAGADPNLPDDNGSTPLHVICSIKGHDDDSLKKFFDVNDRLLRIVHVDARDTMGRTPLDVALARGNSKLIELLLSRGVDSCTAYRDGSTPLHHICNMEGNDDGLLRAFFKCTDAFGRTVNVDVRDAEGRTPADVAFIRGNSKLIKLLVARGADVSFANEDGRVQIREARPLPPLIREIEKKSLRLREIDTKDEKAALQIRKIQKELIRLKEEFMKPVRCNECGSMLAKI
ncbi:serine/threonine-protein phosphatase 6 regulatory ankyrin repeat subunit C-like [Trichogramma pretiosum]|uniref:serine/threonine-protein phosphatase 6 regulatory ankyrin repeat subunit C-like n=1 Tax=Trichogramma pretiosum TaxID=7493 RepID=UPI000C71A358|nr:serine/threonine-protein phosphatase 6 regulatory ankyrin repeat subunit C-like [Trichogramma pretiosum]